MSDDEADPELVELLRQTLGLSGRPKEDEVSTDTGVLKDAEFVYNNAIDVSVDMYGTKAAAASIYSNMHQRGYSTETWSQQPLHPKQSEGFSEVDIINFVFTMDLLNFSFWSELSSDERYQVEYSNQRWTGYNSLVACLRRALEEHIPITTPRFWNDPKCSDGILKHVFRSATSETIPLLDDRIAILREAGQLLQESFRDPGTETEGHSPVAEATTDGLAPAAIVEDAPNALGLADSKPVNNSVDREDVKSAEPKEDINQSESEPPPAVESHLPGREPNADTIPLAHTDPQAGSEIAGRSLRPDFSVVRLIERADHSAGKLVNLLAKHFPSFRDEARLDGRKVRFLKRAQIFVADIWAAFNGTSYGAFDDIGHLTMFAGMLALVRWKIAQVDDVPDYRVPQILHSLGVLVYSPPLDHAIRTQRSIQSGHSWEVQLRGCSIWAVELIRREILRQHSEATNLNAVLIDFFLYDLAKEREAAGGELRQLEKLEEVPAKQPAASLHGATASAAGAA